MTERTDKDSLTVEAAPQPQQAAPVAVPNFIVAGPTATDLALWDAMNEAEKVGKRTDDKLIRKALNERGLYLVRAIQPPAMCEKLTAVPDDLAADIRAFSGSTVADFLGPSHMALVLSQKINEWADRLAASPQAAPAQTQQAAQADTVQLVGVKADGSEHDLGAIRMPAKMKAREIVRDMLGPIDEEAGNDAAFALWCCEQLLEYIAAAPPQGAPASAPGPRSLPARLSCSGCPALKTEDWTEYLENDETDRGTYATCAVAEKNISSYWNDGHPVPGWCPAGPLSAKEAPAPAPQRKALTDEQVDWCYSRDEESYRGADSREAAIAELGERGGWIAKEVAPEELLSPLNIGSSVFEAVSEALGDEIGEHAECFAMTNEEQTDLGRKVLSWITEGPGFHCFGVKDIERIEPHNIPQPDQQEKTR